MARTPQSRTTNPCAGYFVHPLGFVGKNCINFIRMKKEGEDVTPSDIGLYRSYTSSAIAGSLNNAQ